MFTKIVLFYLWGNCLYFAFHFISKNQNLDSFISYFTEVYSFEWTNSLGIVGDFIHLGLSIILMIFMGLSVVVALRLLWKFFTNKINLDKDFD
jgi:hypothetical protein